MTLCPACNEPPGRYLIHDCKAVPFEEYEMTEAELMEDVIREAGQLPLSRCTPGLIAALDRLEMFREDNGK